jgi:regulator of sirC expression with transglutaminase-like and TPR domain
MVREAIREKLSKLAGLPDDELNLAEAALLLAEEDYPDLSHSHYLRFLDDAARSVFQSLGSTRDPYSVVGVMKTVLYDRLGFVGNKEEYYDPLNSFINQVIDRRKGIPITLSLIYMEVGWRVGIELRGIGFPGHFIVQLGSGKDMVFVDPFNEGLILIEEDLEDLLFQVFGKKVKMDKQFLKPVTKHQILTRMLYNLKGIYVQNDETEKAISVIDRIILLNPSAAPEYRDRGLMHFQMSNFDQAVADLSFYLANAPAAEDASEIRSYIEMLGRRP